MGMFASVPLNMLGDHSTADYLVTGNWSSKAASEVPAWLLHHLLGSCVEDDDLSICVSLAAGPQVLRCKHRG